MRELNIATFIQIMQVGLKTHDKQFAAGEFLLEALNRPNDERFAGYYEGLSDKKVSKLVNRQSPVPDGIQQASLVSELAADAVKYYETKVMADMNPFRKDDVFSQLVKVIKEDTEIGDKKREELLKLYNDGKEGTFLGELFLYVVNRPNTPGDSFVGYEDAPLIGEANYECPLCHNKLVETVKEKPVRRYEITQIFPEGLSKDKEKELAAVYPKPKDVQKTIYQIRRQTITRSFGILRRFFQETSKRRKPLARLSLKNTSVLYLMHWHRWMIPYSWCRWNTMLST